MKNSIFFIIILGMILLCVSLLLTNVYILGVSEIFLIFPAFYLIKTNLKKL